MKRSSCGAGGISVFGLGMTLWLLAFGADRALAGEITLQISATTSVSDTTVEAEYQLTNLGSDPASQVEVEATFGGESRGAKIADKIGPKESQKGRVIFARPAGMKGSYPIYTQVRYRDPNDKKFSIAALGIARTEGAPVSELTLSVQVQPKEWGHLLVSARSRNPQVTSVELTCYTPGDLKVESPRERVTLKRGVGKAEFIVVNKNGNAGSSYGIFVGGEYDLDGSHHFADAHTALRISGTVETKEEAEAGSTSPWVFAFIGILITVAAGVAASFYGPTREWMRRTFEGTRWPVLVLELLALLAVEFFIILNVSPGHLITNTITGGGDTGSHFYTVWYMKHWLLPHFEVSDWTPGNYAGFPILQFYFPLPFLLMCILNLLIPLTVAFKLVSLLGTFLLPVAAYVMLKWMRVPFPVPALSAVFMLPFLFNCENSMWGGNIPSTLAGELSYSLSMAISLLLLGSLYRGCQENRRVLLNAFLVFLVGFSHGYTLLFCEAASLFFLLTPNGFVRRVLYLAKVYGLGFCMLAFWLVPLLVYSQYTTAYHTVWKLSKFKEMARGFTISLEIFPEIIHPFLFLAGMGLIGLLVWGTWGFRRGGSEALRSLSFLAFGLAVSVVMFIAAPKLGVVDIRYVAYGQLMAFFIAALALGWLGVLLSRVGLNWALLVLLTGATLVWMEAPPGLVKWLTAWRQTQKWVPVTKGVDYVPSWCRWNYEGFESKAAWPLFQKINNALRGTFQDPRVVFEHSSAHDQFGTTRAFESLPYFAGDGKDPHSGRATLEGLYMQASISAPFVFYIQSEVSQEKSRPFDQYTYATMDYGRARRHLELFNVRDLIIKSSQAKQALRGAPDYELWATFEDYELWRLKTNPGSYVAPLQFEPLLYEGKDWKQVSHQWFTADDLFDTPLLFSQGPASPEDRGRFTAVTSLAAVPRKPIDTSGCVVKEEVLNNEIRIRTNWLHKPLLVKMSYHPDWHVEGADKVYLASPSFMVIYPNQENVRLYYARSWPGKLGLALGALALLILGMKVPLPRRKRTAWSLLAERFGLPESLEPRIPFNPSARVRWTLLLGACLLAATAVICTCVYITTHGAQRLFNTSVALKDSGDKLYKKGQKNGAHRDFEQARAGFRKVMAQMPNAAQAQDAAYYIGITYYMEDDDAQAVAAFEDFLRRYPRGDWSPVVEYHIGLCQLRGAQKLTGTEAQSLERTGIERMRAVVRKYPGHEYAQYATERLREHNALDSLLPRELPDDPGRRLAIAIGLFNEDRIAECMPIFEKIVTESPDSDAAPRALACLAICHFKQERWGKTIGDYEKLIERYPSHELVPEALYHIALCNQKMGREELAKEKYRSLIKTHPQSREAEWAADRLKELGEK